MQGHLANAMRSSSWIQSAPHRMRSQIGVRTWKMVSADQYMSSKIGRLPSAILPASRSRPMTANMKMKSSIRKIMYVDA